METSIPCSHASVRGLQSQPCFESFFLILTHVFLRKRDWFIWLLRLTKGTDRLNSNISGYFLWELCSFYPILLPLLPCSKLIFLFLSCLWIYQLLKNLKCKGGDIFGLHQTLTFVSETEIKDAIVAISRKVYLENCFRLFMFVCFWKNRYLPTLFEIKRKWNEICKVIKVGESPKNLPLPLPLHF